MQPNMPDFMFGLKKKKERRGKKEKRMEWK